MPGAYAQSGLTGEHNRMGDSSLLEADKTDIDPFSDTGTIKVMTSEPSAGLIDCQVFDNRIDFYMELARLESRSKFKFFTGNTGRMSVNYAREVMATEAISAGMDYILMLDDDQIIPKGLFERLFKTMEKTGADIVSPMVTQRYPPFNPVMWKQSWSDEGNKKNILNEFIEDYEPNSIVECDAVGFGVVLIRLEMVKKIKQPRFFSNTHLGEDIFFCIKAKGEAGAKIVMDTSIKVGHMRPSQIATEHDFVKAKNLEKKFEKVYGHFDKVSSIDALNVETQKT